MRVACGRHGRDIPAVISGLVDPIPGVVFGAGPAFAEDC